MFTVAKVETVCCDVYLLIYHVIRIKFYLIYLQIHLYAVSFSLHLPETIFNYYLCDNA